MRRLWRYLLEPGDESLVRSWAGLLYGVSIVTLPVAFDVMDVRTTLIAASSGGVPTLFFWRQILEPKGRLLPVIALVTLFAGMVLIARNFEGLALFVYWGGVILVLSVMRLVHGWRDAYPGSPAEVPAEDDLPEPKHQPLLELVIVVPFLALLGLTVWVIVVNVVR